nr:MAG TPA: hypothetical protein [Caudoviricetes sp.]
MITEPSATQITFLFVTHMAQRLKSAYIYL